MSYLFIYTCNLLVILGCTLLLQSMTVPASIIPTNMIVQNTVKLAMVLTEGKLIYK